MSPSARARAEVQITARMFEMQETAQRIWGAKYAENIAPWKDAILRVSERANCDVMRAALQLAKDCAKNLTDGDVLALTAATVELIEGEEQAA